MSASSLLSRRTIHQFKPDPVPDDLILEALDAARHAPNHRMTEPWRFYWLGEDAKQAVVDLNAELVTARKGPEAGEAKRVRWATIPGWIAVTSAKSDDEVRDREDYAATSVAIQNFMLSLWQHGVGTKWTTGPVTRDPRFFELLGIDPDREHHVGLMWYGWPAKVPNVRPRKPVQDVLIRV